jgi:hypothetical protein
VQRRRTGIATVCLSGTLEDKLAAAAAAGFDGVEIFETDLIASPLSPVQARRSARAEALRAPVLPRNRGEGEAELSAVAAPDTTSVFFCRTSADWLTDFLPTGVTSSAAAGLTHVDHVGLSQPFDSFDEAALFYRAVLGLQPEALTELAAPFGLVRSRARFDADHAVLGVAAARRVDARRTGSPARRLADSSPIMLAGA